MFLSLIQPTVVFSRATYVHIACARIFRRQFCQRTFIRPAVTQEPTCTKDITIDLPFYTHRVINGPYRPPIAKKKPKVGIYGYCNYHRCGLVKTVNQSSHKMRKLTACLLLQNSTTGYFSITGRQKLAD